MQVGPTKGHASHVGCSVAGLGRRSSGTHIGAGRRVSTPLPAQRCDPETHRCDRPTGSTARVGALADVARRVDRGGRAAASWAGGRADYRGIGRLRRLHRWHRAVHLPNRNERAVRRVRGRSNRVSPPSLPFTAIRMRLSRSAHLSRLCAQRGLAKDGACPYRVSRLRTHVDHTTSNTRKER